MCSFQLWILLYTHQKIISHKYYFVPCTLPFILKTHVLSTSSIWIHIIPSKYRSLRLATDALSNKLRGLNCDTHYHTHTHTHTHTNCKLSKKQLRGNSLVAQLLRIRLPMQGTQVWALVREDPTCRGATKPVRHNYWPCALEPVLCNKGSHCNEKPAHRNEEQPPPTAARESPRAAAKTQCSHK